MSHSHAIRRLRRFELDKYRHLGWTQCRRGGCKRDHAFEAFLIRDTGQRVRDRLCDHHAELFATKHGLTLPGTVPAWQRPVDHTAPLPASVIERGADTLGARGVR